MTESTQPITPDWSRIEGRTFKHGSHNNASCGLCAMEAYALALGIKHTDVPEVVIPACAPKSIAKLIRNINDAGCWDSDEQRTEALRPRLERLPLALHGVEWDRKRAYIAAHFAAQRAADACDAIKESDLGSKLRAATIPTSREEAVALNTEARRVRDRCYEIRRERAAYAANAAANAAAYAANAAADADAAAAADADAAANAAYAAANAANAAAYAADAAANAADAAAAAANAAYAAAAYAAAAAANAAYAVAAAAYAAAADAAAYAVRWTARREALLSMLDRFLSIGLGP